MEKLVAQQVNNSSDKSLNICLQDNGNDEKYRTFDVIFFTKHTNEKE